ncbi:reverse transcriptase domain, Reverse transcriptase zinc-binding domain protein [Artemisia annua]|uniref:Reverse transcriptase domain, Reverse transcriptase zinc-binding domain protein n=1 Tax=Artemisia annua TaxID=35608 RepID=A0A2U1PW27_ARTAN|nr:reverse transcriptase domain, Reverse transcriptase zinc-binding domain protein [Artemisia annua]
MKVEKLSFNDLDVSELDARMHRLKRHEAASVGSSQPPRQAHRVLKNPSVESNKKTTSFGFSCGRDDDVFQPAGKKKNRNKGKAKTNTAGNTFNGLPVGKNMYYRPKFTTTPSQTAQGEASTSSGPPSKKNITPSNGNDKTFQSNPKASSPNITVTVSTSNPLDSLAFDEGVQEGSFAIFQPYRISDHSPCILRVPHVTKPKPKPFKFSNFLVYKEGFLDTVTSGWNQNVNGCSMYRVVKRLKGLKSSFRKLLHNQGNLHERVDSLQKELDEKLDSVPPVLADVITFLIPISNVFQPYRVSDHSPAILHIPTLCKFKPRPFKFSNILVKNSRFKQQVQEYWSTTVTGFDMFKVVSKLKALKKPFRKMLFREGNIHENVVKLLHELDMFQRALD